MRKIMFLAAAMFALSGAHAQQQEKPAPFGLRMGMTVRELEALGPMTKKNGYFTTGSVPKPSSAFESYMLIVSPTTGLAKVVAVGKTLQTNGYGFEVKHTFEELEQVLVGRYGEGDTKVDRLVAGSIWRDGNDWMMGLLKKDRKLVHYWIFKPDPRGDVHSIALKADALSSRTGYVSLSYEFTNFSEHSAKLSAEDRAGL